MFNNLEPLCLLNREYSVLALFSHRTLTMEIRQGMTSLPRDTGCSKELLILGSMIPATGQ